MKRAFDHSLKQLVRGFLSLPPSQLRSGTRALYSSLEKGTLLPTEQDEQSTMVLDLLARSASDVVLEALALLQLLPSDSSSVIVLRELPQAPLNYCP